MATDDEMLDAIINSMDMSLSKLWETVKDRQAWCAAIHGFTKSTMVWSLNWGTGIRLENAEPAEVTTEEPGPRELHFCLQLVLVRNDRILPNSPRFA